MKKVLLLLVFGLMTMFGYSQNSDTLKYINCQLIGDNSDKYFDAIQVLDVIFKPDSIYTQCDRVFAEKYFKKRFNKKYMLVREDIWGVDTDYSESFVKICKPTEFIGLFADNRNFADNAVFVQAYDEGFNVLMVNKKNERCTIQYFGKENIVILKTFYSIE